MSITMDSKSAPMVTIGWSESGELYKKLGAEWGTEPIGTYPLPEVDRLLGDMDMQSYEDPELGYHETAFTLHYVMDGEQKEYEGSYDLGEGSDSLIGHIRRVARGHVDYYTLRPNLKGAQEIVAGWEETLERLVPYLEMHEKLSDMERAIDGLQDKCGGEKGVGDYCDSFRAYIAECREAINHAPGGGFSFSADYMPKEPDYREFGLKGAPETMAARTDAASASSGPLGLDAASASPGPSGLGAASASPGPSGLGAAKKPHKSRGRTM